MPNDKNDLDEIFALADGKPEGRLPRMAVVKIAFLLLLLCACSYFERQPKLSDTASELPAWVYAPYELCVEERELCATGEAKTMALADAHAKRNLASIFEVKIKSDLHASSSVRGEAWQAKVQQEVMQSLQESVDQVLETVQVKRHFKKEGLTYSLASLDREKATELLKARIRRIDEELETLWERRSRTQLRKIMRLVLEREKLNERYSIVSGSPIPAPVTYEEVLRWKETRASAGPIKLKVGTAPDWLREKLRELLTEAGFTLRKGETPKVLSLHMDSIREHLNVVGFEKYTFTMNLTSTEGGEPLKVITTSETVIGRNQKDALLKARDYFNHYLEEHLSDLHLD